MEPLLIAAIVAALILATGAYYLASRRGRDDGGHDDDDRGGGSDRVPPPDDPLAPFGTPIDPEEKYARHAASIERSFASRPAARGKRGGGRDRVPVGSLATTDDHEAPRGD